MKSRIEYEIETRFDLIQRIKDLRNSLRLFGESSALFAVRAQELHDREIELQRLDSGGR